MKNISTTKSDIRFSIIVIHRNGEQRLLDFLKHCCEITNPLEDEIIIVDNHSTDNSLKLAKENYHNICIIKNNYNTGYAYACNQGIQHSKGNYILICNNDIILPKKILEQFIIDFNENPQAGLIGGQLLSFDGFPTRSAANVPSFYSELGFKSKRKLDLPTDKPSIVGSVVGACMAIRRIAITEAGLMDEDFFFYYEETEWCMRFAKYGWTVMFDPRIKIPHIGGASTKSISLNAHIEFMRSRLIFWKKSFTPTKIYLLFITNTTKLILSLGFYIPAVILTLGQQPKTLAKLKEKSIILIWLLLGRCQSWGLADKSKIKTTHSS